MSWQDFYKTVTSAFHEQGPNWSGPGHHGVDFAVGARGVVPAYFTGTCVLNGHSDALGNYSVFQVGSVFIGYAHLLVGTRPDVGAKVKPGDRVGLAAGRGDDHGYSWTGPHCHTTRSNYLTGIYDGRTIDPWPAIKAAVAASRNPQPAATKTITVRPGDNLTAIAKANGTTVAKILALPQTPHISDPDEIAVGQRIRVK